MKPAIAGTFLLIMWIAGMVIWGGSKDIKPNLFDDGRPQLCRTSAHPLWEDC